MALLEKSRVTSYAREGRTIFLKPTALGLGPSHH